MMNQPGYPLPSGDAYTDDMVCQLIYLPNKDEYWQALLAALHYFSTWKAWERDDDRRGADAALAWRESFELTMGCWRMTCLDEIVDRMDIMIDLLGNQSSCCGTTTIGPIITVITNITPGEGDDPSVWGETAVADWDEWLEYVCYHAHVYVDSLINGATAIDVAIELGSYTIDFFVGIMRFMQYLGLDQVLGLNQVMMVYEAFRDETDMSGWFTPLADKFEDSRQDIVCSILEGGSLSDAVEAAIDDNVVWLLFYVLTDYEAVQALMYEATVDSVAYLPPIKRDDCFCPEDFGQDEWGMWPNGYYAEWETVQLVNVVWDTWEGLGSGGGAKQDYRLQFLRSGYPAIFGITNVSSRTMRIEFDYMFYTGGSAEVSDFLLCFKALSDMSPVTYIDAWEQYSDGGAGGTWDEWHHAVIADGSLPDVLCNLSDKRPFWFCFGRTSTKLNRRLRIKNLQVWTSWSVP